MKLFDLKFGRTGSWYFPSGKNLEKTSASNAYVETFNDKKIESLAREICQNSLDAADQSGKPVRVIFKMMSVDKNDIPGVKEFLDNIIPAAELAWPHEEKTRLLLQKMRRTLSQPTINVLKISDEYTTGLEQQNWESLIEQAGSSVKRSHESGGSFGIGKAAPFAVSDLRMVFYNTLAQNSAEQSIGVMKFVSFNQGNETTQGTGYLGQKEKIPFNKGVSFDSEVRQRKGTDVYIMGFNTDDFPQYQSEIIYSVLDNFLVSIYRNQLEVIVENELLNKETMATHIQTIMSDKKLSKKYMDLISYYGVLSDPTRIVRQLPKFEAYQIKEGEALLILSNKTENNRRVLMTRKAGMKIFDKKSISGVLKFSGVFQATGSTINKVLKDLENPNHDKWSIDRATDKKQAKLFLDFLTRFIKDAVTEEYQEKVTQEVDAFGVSDFLPSNLETLKGSKAIENAAAKKTEVKIKKPLNTSQPTNTTPIRSEEAGELLDKIIKDVSVEDGDSGGSGFENGQGGGNGGDNYIAGGDDFGQYQNDENGDEMKFLANISRKRIADMHYRVIESNAKFGQYRIVLKPEQTIHNVKIAISIIGDSGKKSPVKVKTASNDLFGDLSIRQHNVYIAELVQGKWQAIDVKVNQYNRVKLEVEVDANFE